MDDFYAMALFDSYIRAIDTNNMRRVKQLSSDPFLRDITCPRAALVGNLSILKWARRRGHPWGDTCIRAAQNKHFRLLKWAKDNGAPWCIKTTGLLAEADNDNMLHYFLSSPSPKKTQTYRKRYYSNHV